MNNINSFQFGSNPVRVVSVEGDEPWFVAKDACNILDLSNVGQAISTLDADEKQIINHADMVRMGITRRDDLDITRLVIISESGLYQLIFKSIKPEARAFQKWITSEVLPAIRKTGSYSVNQFEALIPKTFSEALRALATTIEEKEVLALQVRVDAPKVDFHNAVAVSDDGHSVGEVAKVLGTGQNRLFAWLHGQHILMSSNLPYQEHIDAGRFRVIEQVWEGRNGQHVSPKTLVTGKGLIWIQRLWNEV